MANYIGKVYHAVPAQIVRDGYGDEVPMEAGPCLWCGQWVEEGREMAGATNPLDPCWHHEGDFGCMESPETSEEGCGSHMRPFDLAVFALHLDPSQAPNTDGLIAALRQFRAAAQPIRNGERNGAVFGNLSIADDNAQAALAAAQAPEVANLDLLEVLRSLVDAGPLVKLNVRKHYHWMVAQEAAKTAIAAADRAKTAGPTDKAVLDRIAGLMSGKEWDADTLDAIAETVMVTGRTIDEPR